MEFHRASQGHAWKEDRPVTKVEGELVDGDLRQFIAHHLSLHTSHMQTLLEGLEQRIVDSCRGTANPTVNVKANPEFHTESSPSRHNEQISALRGASIVTFASEASVPVDTLPGSISHADSLPKRATLETVFTPSPSNVSDATPEPPPLEERTTHFDERRNLGTKQFDVEKEMKQLAAGKNVKRTLMRKGTRSVRFSVWSLSSMQRLTVRQRIKGLMSTRQAELAVSSLIFANAMVFGAQVDHQMKSPDANKNNEFDFFRAIDVVFTVLFTVELILRLVADTISHYFSRKNQQLYWNIFDCMLIVLSILEELLNVLLGSMPNISLLRLFRMFRLVRIFRIVRVMRFFRDLRIMASGIAQSMQSLVWALMLLLSLMYFTAVCLMQFAAEEGQSRAKNDGVGELTDVQYRALMKYYGSLFKSLFTLYTSITGGIDWREAADPLFDLGWVFGIFYSSYIAFAVLCVMNIITGVFVENCNKMTAKDEDLVYMEQLDQRRQWYDEVHEIFNAADSDRSGFLNVREFSDKVEEDARLRAWMRKIGVHVESYSANGLFQLLDLDGDGVLDFNEFALALQQLHGQARSIDVAKIAHSMHVLRRLVLGMAERMTPDLIKNDRVLTQARLSLANANRGPEPPPFAPPSLLS